MCMSSCSSPISWKYYLCSLALLLLLCLVSVGYIYGVYLWGPCSFPLIYLFMLCPISYCLDYCGFTVGLEIGYYPSSNFVLLLQYCFGYSGLFIFLIKFRISLSISAITCWDCIEAIDKVATFPPEFVLCCSVSGGSRV